MTATSNFKNVSRLNPLLPKGGGFRSPTCVFFRIPFFAAEFSFSLIGILHQYMGAHSGENGIQISLRVLEIYIFFHEVNF